MQLNKCKISQILFSQKVYFLFLFLKLNNIIHVKKVQISLLCLNLNCFCFFIFVIKQFFNHFIIFVVNKIYLITKVKKISKPV